MVTWIRHSVAPTLADRKGVTALEYAMIAAGAMTIIVACYQAYFERMAIGLTSIGFPT